MRRLILQIPLKLRGPAVVCLFCCLSLPSVSGEMTANLSELLKEIEVLAWLDLRLAYSAVNLSANMASLAFRNGAFLSRCCLFNAYSSSLIEVGGTKLGLLCDDTIRGQCQRSAERGGFWRRCGFKADFDH